MIHVEVLGRGVCIETSACRVLLNFRVAPSSGWRGGKLIRHSVINIELDDIMGLFFGLWFSA